MNVNNVVRTITIRGSSEGIEKLTGDLGRLAGAQENVAVVSESSARRTLSVQDAWRKQTLALDEAARSYSRAASATKVADSALNEGLISQQQYAARLDLIAQKYGVVTVAAEKFARAQALSSVNSAPAVNQRLGVKDDFGTAIRANDIAAYGKQLDDVRAKYNPLFAAGRQYKEALSEINAAAKTGAISERERVAEITRTKAAFVDQVGAIRNSTAVMGQNTKAVGLNRYEILNLSRQMQDVVVSLQGGQSLGVVLTQQGSQVLDVFQAANGSVRGFASQAIGWLGRFAASTAGVVTGIGAIAAGALYMAGSWSDAQREIDKALIGVGRRSGVTAKDINEIARGSSSAIGLSVGEARESALEFAKTGAIYRDNIKAATDATHNFSIATGQDAKDAATDFAKALADPAAGAETLNQKLGFLDGKTRELVISLVNQNRTQEAQRILIDGVAASTEKAAQTLSIYAKAWNLVGNAASAAKNSIGSALSGQSEQGQLDQLRERRQQLTSGPGIGLFNQLGNRGEIARIDAEITKLEASLRKAAAAAADDRFKQFSIDADNAVRALQPQIQQLQAIEKALADIKRAQADANVGGKQGLGASNDPAARAGQAAFINLSESAAQADRLNSITLAIASNFRDVGVETAKVLINLSFARDVAAAASGAEQIHAQEVARTVQLYLEGKTIIEATAIASAERAVAEAQVNAQIENQIHALEQSTELIKARQNGTEATVKAEQAYENAIRAGADAATASALQAATLSNERARANERAASQAAREAAEMDRIVAAAREKARIDAFVPSGIPYSELFTRKDGGKSQFNPEGYTFTTSVATQQSLSGSSYTDPWSEYYATLAGGLGKTGKGMSTSLGGGPGLDTDKIASLERLIALMPKEQQITATQSLIQELTQRTPSLERDESINRLTQSLNQLREATEANTEALRITTDPLITQGHDYLNNLKIGYYRAASGLDVVARGPSTGDTIPFHAMVNGGERIQITPAGAMPRAANSNAQTNDNSRNVQVHVSQTINIADTSIDLRTARQRGQGFVGAVVRSVTG